MSELLSIMALSFSVLVFVLASSCAIVQVQIWLARAGAPVCLRGMVPVLLCFLVACTGVAGTFYALCQLLEDSCRV